MGYTIVDLEWWGFW